MLISWISNLLLRSARIITVVVVRMLFTARVSPSLCIMLKKIVVDHHALL
ncbi:hypothetical protein Fmac_022394 [Flemingia macrophylla]|uniref:Uncharacterized protein n=1 Tax=Flemingia macrophylla TaxID=520843 RepID=A0ABD1LZZ4_9FABA